MKTLSWFWGLCALVLIHPLAANEAASVPAAAESPLTAEERALPFQAQFVHVRADGQAVLEIHGEPFTVAQIWELSPWDLMEILQAVSGTPLLLSRMGQGRGDGLTEAWQAKLAAFVVSHQGPHEFPQADLFDPALVLWDPGYIQKQNEWGQWTVQLQRRAIVQGDIATLSPLEIQQAVRVLTGRTYSIEFVMKHLEAFRAQLTVRQRLEAPLVGRNSP